MSVLPESPLSARGHAVPVEELVAWRRLSGVFDASAAVDLGTALVKSTEGRALHLDFSRVSRVEDRGLAALAALLTAARREEQVFFHGLSRHHIRLLGYFGVDAERSANEASPVLQ